MNEDKISDEAKSVIALVVAVGHFGKSYLNCTPEEQLDYILEGFYTKKFNGLSDKELATLQTDENSIRKYDSLDYQTKQVTAEIIEKLYDDRFLRKDGDKDNISFPGIMFKQSGGYVQQKRDKERERKVHNINIWAVTIGGVGAAISGLYVLYLIAAKVFSWLCY